MWKVKPISSNNINYSIKKKQTTLTLIQKKKTTIIIVLGLLKKTSKNNYTIIYNKYINLKTAYNSYTNKGIREYMHSLKKKIIKFNKKNTKNTQQHQLQFLCL